jgi:hypothetical protein
MGVQTCPVVGHHFLSIQKLKPAHIATFLIRVSPPPTFLSSPPPISPPSHIFSLTHSFPSAFKGFDTCPSYHILTVLDNNYRYNSLSSFDLLALSVSGRHPDHWESQPLPTSAIWSSSVQASFIFQCFQQCWGSGSVGFVCLCASRIRIR